MNIAQAKEKIYQSIRNNSNELSLFNLRFNQDELNEIIPLLQKLKRLAYFCIQNSKLPTFDFLKDLPTLVSIELVGNSITDIDFLKEMTYLTSVRLSKNNLTNADALKNFIELRTLHLKNNNLSNLNFLSELKFLEELDVSCNNLSNSDFLNELKHLKILDVSSNKLSSFNFLESLTELSGLNLSNNYFTTENLPKSIRNLVSHNYDGGWLTQEQIDQIKNFSGQLKQGKDYIYEARVLIVGEPKAGKTTLTKKVKDNKKWNDEIRGVIDESTVGIEIETLPFSYHKDSTKQITAHFWDFGGQDIQYVLHQYFFTERSLYVLLADGRKESPNFNYWFEIIATLGRNCPVLVVLNETGGKPVKTFNINEYREQYGNYLESIEERSVDFYDDSDGKFDTLKAEIEHKTSNLKHIGSPLPKTWVDVRKELEKLKAEKSYIEKDEFLKVCEKCNLTNKDYIAQVTDYLHDLGIALNYKNDANLRNKFILRPNWVIDALYVVLQDNKIETDRGMFEVDYVDSLWEKSGYNSTDCDILLGLMQKGKFEIAYKLKENKFIVPILLPYKPEVEYKLDGKNEIQTVIEYKFMPKGIVPRLIVRLHKSILSKHGQQVVWNKGVLLSHQDSIAEVVEKEQSKHISIKVSGANAVHNKEMLTIIRNEIVGIHYEWFDNRLTYEELVPCVCDVCKKAVEKQFYKLSVLENALMKGIDVQCQTSFEQVNTREMVEGIYIEDKSKGPRKNMAGSTFNIAGNAQIIQEANDNSSVTQNNFENKTERNLDEIFANLAEKQTKDLETILAKIDTVLSKQDETKENQLEIQKELITELQMFIEVIIDKFDEADRKEYEKIIEAKDFDLTVKLVVPFIDKLGLKIESKEIKVKFFEPMKRVRNYLYGQNVKENPSRLND
jgi:internalin A